MNEELEIEEYLKSKMVSSQRTNENEFDSERADLLIEAYKHEQLIKLLIENEADVSIGYKENSTEMRYIEVYEGLNGVVAFTVIG